MKEIWIVIIAVFLYLLGLVHSYYLLQNLYTIKNVTIEKIVIEKEGLTREQATLLYAIRYVENGGPGREFGVIRKNANTYKDGYISYFIQCTEAAKIIKKYFNGDYDKFAEHWAHPKDLKEWKRNIKFAMLISYLKHTGERYDKK
jgi:hypothetical protein